MLKNVLVLAVALYCCLLSGIIEAQTTPPDPCASYVCQNNGICVVDNSAPYCACSNGFTGTFCEIGKPKKRELYI